MFTSKLKNRTLLLSLHTCGIVASLAAAGALAVPGSAVAATLTWPGAAPCNATLQACLDAAASGDTVELAFDTLNGESLSVTDKSLTLQPAGARTPKLQSLHVGSNNAAVSFTVRGLAGVQQMSAFCGAADLDLTVRDNVIGGADRGLRIYDNYALINSGRRTIHVIGNRFTLGGAHPVDAIGILGSNSPFVAEVFDNDIQFTTAAMSAGISVNVDGGRLGGLLNHVTIDRNRITGANFNAGIQLSISGGSDSNSPSVLLDASVTNNLIAGQNGNTGLAGGIAGHSAGNNTTLNARIVNNTIVDGVRGINIGARADTNGVANIIVRNNIVAWNSGYGTSIDADSLITSAFNLMFANGASESQGGPVADTIEVDPRFVDHPGKNYRLAYNSPAIDAGLDAALSPIFMLDAAGSTRRIGRIDIGAYEAQPGAPTATTLAISHETAEVNQPVAATVTVSSRLPTLAAAAEPGFAPVVVAGTVNVTSSGGASCVATLSNGSGACTLSHAMPGTHEITATYVGDGQNAMSSDTASLVVSAASPASAPALSDELLGLLVAMFALAGACGVRR